MSGTPRDALWTYLRPWGDFAILCPLATGSVWAGEGDPMQKATYGILTIG